MALSPSQPLSVSSLQEQIEPRAAAANFADSTTGKDVPTRPRTTDTGVMMNISAMTIAVVILSI